MLWKLEMLSILRLFLINIINYLISSLLCQVLESFNYYSSCLVVCLYKNILLFFSLNCMLNEIYFCSNYWLINLFIRRCDIEFVDLMRVCLLFLYIQVLEWHLWLWYSVLVLAMWIMERKENYLAKWESMWD